MPIKSVLVFFILAAPHLAAEEARVLTLDSSSPLLQVKVSLKAGSAADPAGMEGLSYLTARLLLEGGFGETHKLLGWQSGDSVVVVNGSGRSFYTTYAINLRTGSAVGIQ